MTDPLASAKKWYAELERFSFATRPPLYAFTLSTTYRTAHCHLRGSQDFKLSRSSHHWELHRLCCVVSLKSHTSHDPGQQLYKREVAAGLSESALRVCQHCFQKVCGSPYGWRGRLHSRLDGIREICKLQVDARVTLLSWTCLLVADIVQIWYRSHRSFYHQSVGRLLSVRNLTDYNSDRAPCSSPLDTQHSPPLISLPALVSASSLPGRSRGRP